MLGQGEAAAAAAVAAAGGGSSAPASRPGSAEGGSGGQQQLTWLQRWCGGVSARQVPKVAVLYALGELAVRVEEEQQRRAAAQAWGVTRVRRRRMGDMKPETFVVAAAGGVRWMAQTLYGSPCLPPPCVSLHHACPSSNVPKESSSTPTLVAPDHPLILLPLCCLPPPPLPLPPTPPLYTQEHLMQGDACCQDAAGTHTNTADTDCAVCRADLWLSAVVSPDAPGRAVCPEHAAQLGPSPDACTLLYRWAAGRGGRGGGGGGGGHVVDPAD
jgi:hypothetical protein